MAKVLLTFGALITLVFSSSLPLGARTSTSAGNYPILPVTFTGVVNGHAYELNGTAEQVWAQLKGMYPEIELKNSAREIQTRDALNKVKPPLCIPVSGQSWTDAGASAIEDGVNYLNKLNARINQPAKSCGRISCSYDSGIYLCNDNTYEISPASPYLASYAQDLINSCSFTVGGGADNICGGQEFDTDNYNVIVHSDSC